MLVGCFWLCPNCPGSKRFAHPSDKQSKSTADMNQLSEKSPEGSTDETSNEYKRRSRKSAKLTLQTLTPRNLIPVPEESDIGNNHIAFTTKQDNDESRNGFEGIGKK